MNAKAIEKIRSSLTPKVSIHAATNVAEGIMAKARLSWDIPSKAPDIPRHLTKDVIVKTDDNGNFIELRGLP